MAVLLMITVKRRMMRDACGIVAFVLCMMCACFLLIAFYIFGEHEIILAINHIIYNTGIFLYFFFNYRDPDYQLHVLPLYPRGILCQRVLLFCIVGADFTIFPLWVVKAMQKISWQNPHCYMILSFMGFMYLCYMLFYSIHTWTLVHTSFDNNKYILNPCMSYLTFIYLSCILLGFVALLTSVIIPQNSVPSTIFPGLIYLTADTEFYLAVLFYILTHTRFAPDRSGSYRRAELPHDDSSSP